MVDTQIRPSDVTKFPIISAMLSVPRENFVPRDKREAAYMGDNIDLGGNRTILDPRTFAKMLDALDIQPTDFVLDIGMGLGYSAAVLSQLGEAVVAVEDDQTRFDEASEALGDFGADNVIPHLGELAEGAAEHGPYDVILIQGAVEHVPDTVLAQIKDGGKIACLFAEGALGTVKIGYKLGGRMDWRASFNAGAPTLDGFQRHRAFTL
jgi:protein-L-isoaspartate(D-aspartate) O-methyltransferase